MKDNNNPLVINVSLVQKLISEQFPHWSHLRITPVEHGGWDNRTFHLGSSMLIRLPSAQEYAAKVKIEQHWLPQLASHLSVVIPTPLAMGKPTEEYPFNWSVYQWIDGQIATKANIDNMHQFAEDLASFILELHVIDTYNGPLPGKHNFYRGAPLKIYDHEVKQACRILENSIDTHKLLTIWNNACASTWNRPPVWLHGDLAPSNIILKNGILHGIIDWGGMAIGDPACDLAIAWTFFDYESREIFKHVLNLDNQTWDRGCGWALWKALIIYAELPGTNPLGKEESQQILDRILFEYNN